MKCYDCLKYQRWYVFFTLFLMALISGCGPKRETGEQIFKEIKEIGRLELAEVASEETFVLHGSGHTLASVRNLDELGQLIDGFLRGGERVGVYAFTRYIVAAIDMDALTDDMIEVDGRGKSIRLTLPPVQVVQSGRDVTMKTLHERYTGNQQRFTPQERQTMKNEASRRSSLLFQPGQPAYNELVDKAEKKAKSYFTSVLQMRGYTDITIEIQRTR